MTKALYAIALAILSVTLLLLWVTSPAQANEEPSKPPVPAGAIRMSDLVVGSSRFLDPDPHSFLSG
ncbi:hypothetical protein CLU84_2433 [Comamonas sp. 26]|nr:hypothetical protein CLU84_2433 [Comamonas sp. 26]